MTSLLRALSALLSACQGMFVYAPGAHFGDVHQVVDDEHRCGHDDYDLDAPQPVLVLIPIASAAGLFEEAVQRGRNGDDPSEVGWEMARTLELGDIDS